MPDQFELVSQLGRGGMGVVWKARDTTTGELIALKLLHDLYAGDAEYVARFEREVELGRRVDSPNVVKVLGFGRREGVPFLAMEYVEGPSLKEQLKQHGPYTWNEAKPLLLQIAHGLEAAHAAGIIHRDVKPSNILLAPDRTAKLADFGIARAADLTGLTSTNMMLGTAMYMAPEGQRDQRSDLFSVGRVGYELLTGRAAVDTTADLTAVPDESARRVLAWLMAPRPEQRPPSASALIAVLEGSSRVPSVRRSRASTPVLVAAVPTVLAIAAIVGVVFALTRNNGHTPASGTPVVASATANASLTDTATHTATATATASATSTATAPPSTVASYPSAEDAVTGAITVALGRPPGTVLFDMDYSNSSCVQVAVCASWVETQNGERMYTVVDGPERAYTVPVISTNGVWEVVGQAEPGVHAPPPFVALYSALSGSPKPDESRSVVFGVSSATWMPGAGLLVEMYFDNRSGSDVAWTSDVGVPGIAVVDHDGHSFPSIDVGGRFATSYAMFPSGQKWYGWHLFPIPQQIGSATLEYPNRAPISLSLVLPAAPNT